MIITENSLIKWMFQDYEKDWEKLNRPAGPVTKPPENPQSAFKVKV